MPKFPNEREAYQWAMEILSIREGGRSNLIILEASNSGPCKDYSILDAIAIKKCAELSCRSLRACPYYTPYCFLDWFLPDPVVEQNTPSQSQEDRIHDCVADFRDRLRTCGFIE